MSETEKKLLVTINNLKRVIKTQENEIAMFRQECDAMREECRTRTFERDGVEKALECTRKNAQDEIQRHNIERNTYRDVIGIIIRGCIDS